MAIIFNTEGAEVAGNLEQKKKIRNLCSTILIETKILMVSSIISKINLLKG